MQRQLSIRAARNCLVVIGSVGMVVMAWMAWDMAGFLDRAEEHAATVVERDRRRVGSVRRGRSVVHELVVDLADGAEGRLRRVTATVTKAAYERHPPGSVVAVLVDPQDPDDVRVDPDPSGPLLMLGLCAVVLAVGGVCHLVWVRRQQEGRAA